MRQFNPTAKHPARAVQAWQILVGKAMNRQTVTYEGLGELMYRKEAAGVLDRILGHVAFYCNDNSLPPLTCVGRGTCWAIPIDQTKLDEQREEVYGLDWYDVYPPSETELEKAYLAHRNSN